MGHLAYYKNWKEIHASQTLDVEVSSADGQDLARVTAAHWYEFAAWRGPGVQGLATILVHNPHAPGGHLDHMTRVFLQVLLRPFQALPEESRISLWILVEVIWKQYSNNISFSLTFESYQESVTASSSWRPGRALSGCLPTPGIGPWLQSGSRLVSQRGGPGQCWQRLWTGCGPLPRSVKHPLEIRASL